MRGGGGNLQTDAAQLFLFVPIPAKAKKLGLLSIYKFSLEKTHTFTYLYCAKRYVTDLIDRFMLYVRPLSCCGEISGNCVEEIYLLLAEGVDGEVDVDEEGHAHNYHKVQVENNLKNIYMQS